MAIPPARRYALLGFVEQRASPTGGWRAINSVYDVRDYRTKKAEESLRRREEHFRILVEQASDGIFISDETGKYVDVNSAGAEMLGYTREEILRLSISDVVNAEERHRVGD